VRPYEALFGEMSVCLLRQLIANLSPLLDHSLAEPLTPLGPNQFISIEKGPFKISGEWVETRTSMVLPTSTSS
jgi:hypothetical protein